MSEVKRWDVESDEQDGPCSLWNVESKDGQFVKYEDFAALQQERDALAAENAAMRNLLGATGFKSETPATDAFLNSVRAEAVKTFCQLIAQYGKVEPHHFNADFAGLYAKINKEVYESILDNPAVYDMESLVDWLEQTANDSRAYADMSIESAAQLRAGEPS